MKEAKNLEGFLSGVHLQWHAETGGDAGDSEGGEAPGSKPEETRGDTGPAKPDTSQTEQAGTGEGGELKLPPYSEQLEKSLRSDPEMQKIIAETKDVNDLFKRYAELRKGNGQQGDGQGTESHEQASNKPEEYNLTVPGNLTEDVANNLKQVAGDAGLNQEQAQKLLEGFAKVSQEAGENYQGEVQKHREKVLSQVKEEFGEKTDEVAADARKMVQKLAGEEFVEWLNTAQVDGIPAGDHPALVLGIMRLSQKIRQRVGDDTLEVETKSGATPRKKGLLSFPNTPGME